MLIAAMTADLPALFAPTSAVYQSKTMVSSVKHRKFFNFKDFRRTEPLLRKRKCTVTRMNMLGCNREADA